MPPISPEESIFYAAIQLSDAEARSGYISRACGSDRQLTQRVESLVSAYSEGEFLESPIGDMAATALLPTVGEQPGDTIGPYKLLEQIGEGGMGLVFMAEQTTPLRRRVALKIIKPGLDTRAVISRFEAERQALALMDHANIARVYDAGATETGRPFFVMELVRGLPITEYCRQKSVPLLERLSLFIEVCHAVQHAHERGIIHRDLKPTNILVAQSDTKPVPKVIDFGVAKAMTQSLTERTLFTAFSQIIGTPLYMSPEQADLGNQDIDTRSDVYSLGVVLYELLTGTTPFDAERLRSVSHDELRRIIREEDPPKPSTRATTLAAGTTNLTQGLDDQRRVLPHLLKGDIDWIVMKALDKDRQRRYDSPRALAADLERFRESQPVSARPPSHRDRLAKWTRRHVGLVWSALASSLIVAAVLGVSVLLIAESRNDADEQQQIAVAERNTAKEERGLAITERNKAQLSQYYAEIVANQVEVAQHNISGARATLAGHLPLSDRADNRGWEWYYLLSQCHPELRSLRENKYFSFAAWSPDGALIAAPGVIWDDKTTARIANFSPSQRIRYRPAWSPDGQRLAWGVSSDDNGLYIWNRTTNVVERLSGHSGSVWCVDWSPNGSQLATGSIDQTVKIWDVAKGSVIRTLPLTGNVINVAWRPDGDVLAASVHFGGVRTFNPETGEALQELAGDQDQWSLDWSPDGRQLFVANDSGWQVLSADDFQVEGKHPMSRGGNAISCSADGTKLAVAHGESIAIWDMKADSQIAELRGHLNVVKSVGWSPDGARLVTSSDNGEIKIWSLAESVAPTPLHFQSPISKIAWAPDNERLIAVSRAEGVAYEWKAGESEFVRRSLPKSERAICVSQDGKLAAIYEADTTPRTVVIVDAETTETLAALPLPNNHQLWPGACAFSIDGSRMAVVTEFNRQMFLTAWDVQHELPLSTWQWERIEKSALAKAITWSPDGTLLGIITFGDKGDGTTTYWADHLNVIDVATGQRVLKHRATGPRSTQINAVSWSPAARLIAIGTKDGRVEVVEPISQHVVFSQKIHADAIHAFAWRPDNTRLACSSVDGTVKLITASAGQPLLTFNLTDRCGSYLAWNGNGRRLAAISAEGGVQIWDATRGYEIAGGGKRRGELAWAYFDRAHDTTIAETRLTLREALRHAPDTMDYWELRARIHALLGDFDQAADEFAKLVSNDIRQNLPSALDWARCLIAAGNEAEYKRLCSSLVSAFGDDRIESNRQEVVGVCLACPTPPVDPSKLLSMARDQRVENEDSDPNARNFFIGACLLRKGQYEDAAQLLSECIRQMPSAMDETSNFRLAYGKYFLALARYHVGHITQAQRLLAEANEHASNVAEFTWRWDGRVDLKSLQREVEDTLNQ